MDASTADITLVCITAVTAIITIFMQLFNFWYHEIYLSKLDDISISVSNLNHDNSSLRERLNSLTSLNEQPRGD